MFIWATKPNAVDFSQPFYGYAAPVRNGVHCHANTATGIRFTNAMLRWCENGLWQRMMEAFADDLDMENGIIDSTIVRAHPCAAGAQKK